MLTELPKALRSRIATIFVALYALCILLPAVAVASNEAPCLTEDHGFAQVHAASEAGHKHADHFQHAHHQHMGDADHDSVAAEGTGDDAQPLAPKCCGIAFFAGVTSELGFTPVSLAPAGRTAFAVNQALASLPPNQLIRPPKSLS